MHICAAYIINIAIIIFFFSIIYYYFFIYTVRY